jgi:polyhydroxyalkanoate synthesis regulator phasin
VSEEKKGARAKVSDGIRQGIGVLSAFKDALEETINEARERGDLSSERAKEVMKGALHKAQEAAEGARGRLDFVRQKEFDGLKEVVDDIRRRVSSLESRLDRSAPEPTPEPGAEPGGEG